MTPEQKTAAIETCSKRAQSLYARLVRGDFYLTTAKNTPKGAMQELIDAGLVGTVGRVARCRMDPPTT